MVAWHIFCSEISVRKVSFIKTKNLPTLIKFGCLEGILVEIEWEKHRGLWTEKSIENYSIAFLTDNRSIVRSPIVFGLWTKTTLLLIDLRKVDYLLLSYLLVICQGIKISCMLWLVWKIISLLIVKRWRTYFRRNEDGRLFRQWIVGKWIVLYLVYNKSYLSNLSAKMKENLKRSTF